MRLTLPLLGTPRPPRIGLGACVLVLVACAAAAATYAGATRIGATHTQAGGLRPAATAPKTMPAPSAAEFALLFVGTANRYASAHGDAVRLAEADCVQASPGHYMCSYATQRPGGPRHCHVMQARWTPGEASSFAVTLAGRSLRCGSLREALRSLR